MSRGFRVVGPVQDGVLEIFCSGCAIDVIKGAIAISVDAYIRVQVLNVLPTKTLEE